MALLTNAPCWHGGRFYRVVKRAKDWQVVEVREPTQSGSLRTCGYEARTASSTFPFRLKGQALRAAKALSQSTGPARKAGK